MNSRARADWWRPAAGIERDSRSSAIRVGTSPAPDSSAPFWALMVFTVILLLAPQTFFPALVPLRVALLTAVVAISAYVFDKCIHRQPIMTLTREMWITASLVGWAIVTIPLSYWPGGSVSFLLGFYSKTLVVFWLLCNTVNTRARLRQLAWGLSAMAAILAASGVSNYLSGDFLSVAGGVNRIVGYESPLAANPNDLTLMLNLILPLSVALFLSNGNWHVRALLLGVILLEVLGVIVTFSRGGFLTLATIVVAYAWKLRNRPERTWVIAAILLVIVSIPLWPSEYFSHMGTITNIEADPTGSAQKRWSQMVAAMAFVSRNPIVGAGVGTSMLAFNEVRGLEWTVIHNVYLEYAVELGIPGLVLFLLLLAGCIQSTMTVQRGSAPYPARRELFCLAEGIQVSLIAFAVAATFHPVAYHFYFYYIAGLAVAARVVHEAESG